MTWVKKQFLCNYWFLFHHFIFNAFINNSNKVICVSNLYDFNFHGCFSKIIIVCCRHERIHTKKGSHMKSQSQTCDDVDDLATLEVLDEVRIYTDPTRERPQHTHIHTRFWSSIHRLRKDRKLSTLLSDSPFISAGIFLTFSWSIFQRDCQVTITHPSSLIF